MRFGRMRRPADCPPRPFAENETRRQSLSPTDARRSAELTTAPALDGNPLPSPPRPSATPRPPPGHAGSAPTNPRVHSLTSECHVRRSNVLLRRIVTRPALAPLFLA